MKKSLLLTAFLCIGFFAGMLAQTAVQGYRDGEIFIKYKYSSIKIKKGENPENINMADMPGVEALVGTYGITKVTKPFWAADDDKNLRYVYKVWFNNKNAVEALIRDMSAVAQIEYAEKVPIEKLDYIPNDPQYGSQWHLAKIGAPNAWNVFNGNSPITVAIVDNAIDINHVDLAANVWVNPGEIAGNLIDDDLNGFIDDVNGFDVSDKDNNPTPPNGTFSHGTHCAGIAAARTDNTVGVAGIGFNVKIMAVKATPSASTAASIYNGYEGIIYAARSKARVISCSWGGTTTATSLQLVIDYAWSKGCIICVSAGNDNDQVLHYPAALNHVYAVASSDNTDTKSGFSCYGTWVDITAPGSNILSTYPFNTYNTISGTSMACPLTAGLAGLILAKNPGLSNQDVLNIISTTATNIYTVSGNAAFVSGSKLGAGRINADGALVSSNASLAWKPLPNFATLTPTVCPSINVQFIDKTIHNPTSWSWTFASGTPATSTASAPVVSWAAPGVYGVTLTATNGNGSNSAVKAGYITITNPITLPLQEGFQTGTQFPPVNWTNYDVGLDTAMWERYVGAGGGSSTVCARFNNWDYQTFPDKDALRTPKYNMTAVTSAKLRFDRAYAIIDPVAYAGFYDSLQVMVSINCGSTWTSIYLNGGPTFTTAPNFSTAIFVPSSTQWKKDSITLTGAAQGIGQGNVMFQFVNRGHYGQPIYIDNINLVYSATAPPTANWSSTGVTCSGQNIALTDLSAGTPTAWVWTMPGGAPATSTLQNPSVMYATAGVYNVTLTASNAFGSTQSSKQITVTTTPTIGISSTKAACFGNCDGVVTATVAPGTPPYTYNVSGGSCPSAPTCSNLCAFTYTYNVTDSKGCTSKKAFTISTPTAAITSNLNGINASCSSCANGTVTSAATGGMPGYTYSWSPGGATTATLSNVLPGCYTLTITDSQGCTDVSTQCIGFAGGVSLLGSINGNVSIIPNPNNGQFVIKADILEAFDVVIYNSIGQLIKSIPQNKSELGIDLSGYGKGIYNVILSSNGNYKNLKVVIQ